MLSVNSYIKQNKSLFLTDLSEFLTIPSVSTQTEHKKDIEKCALWLKNYLQKSGLTNCKILPTSKHPAVFGEYQNPQNKKTLLVYGHYDVQPAEPLSKWKNHPFSPLIKNNKIYARGASDNKGQLFINLYALKFFLSQNINPGINVKFLIEGEEESGGKNLEGLIKKNKKLLAADLALISDSSMLSRTKPNLSYGTRGIVYFEIEVLGPKHDIHSGSYGGIIQNPTNALCRIIFHLQNDQGEVIIPGLKTKIRTLDQEEKKLLQKQINKKDILKETGVNELIGDRNLSVEEIIGAKPSLDVHGIWGGFRKEGEKTIIPDKVTCKLSIRIVPYLTPEYTIKKFVEYIRSIQPKGVKVKIKVLSFCNPYFLSPQSEILKKAKSLVYEAFKVPPVLTLEGGSLPAPAYFKEYLHIETLLLGYGLPDDNLHAPNEKMDLPQFWKGIKNSINLYQKIFL